MKLDPFIFLFKVGKSGLHGVVVLGSVTVERSEDNENAGKHKHITRVMVQLKKQDNAIPSVAKVRFRDYIFNSRAKITRSMYTTS